MDRAREEQLLQKILDEIYDYKKESVQNIDHNDILYTLARWQRF